MHTDSAEIGTQSARSRQRKLRLRTTSDLDMRTAAGKRAAELAATFTAALGGRLSPEQALAVSRAAALLALSEDATTRRLGGDLAVSLDDVVRLASAARRAVRDLGLHRKREPATPTLEDYLAAKHDGSDGTATE
jgi:hypothetical protein